MAALDEPLPALPPGVEQLGELAEALRLERLEGEVLELPLHLPDPESLGQRGVDLHRLTGDPLLLVDRQRGQRAHVVEPIGELDEDDPDVLGHREEHLPDVLGLLLLVGVGAELRQLRDAVHEPGDLGTEALLDVAQAVLGVLRDVVQERRLDRDRVDPELGQDLRRGDRMGDVRLARRALLAGVRRDGHVEGPADRLEVGLRVVLLERGQQLPAERLERALAGGLGRRRRRAPARALGGCGGGAATGSIDIPFRIAACSRRSVGGDIQRGDDRQVAIDDRERLDLPRVVGTGLDDGDGTERSTGRRDQHERAGIVHGQPALDGQPRRLDPDAIRRGDHDPARLDPDRAHDRRSGERVDGRGRDREGRPDLLRIAAELRPGDRDRRRAVGPGIVTAPSVPSIRPNVRSSSRTSRRVRSTSLASRPR